VIAKHKQKRERKRERSGERFILERPLEVWIWNKRVARKRERNAMTANPRLDGVLVLACIVIHVIRIAIVGHDTGVGVFCILDAV
jgi:hypothetical protein